MRDAVEAGDGILVEGEPSCRKWNRPFLAGEGDARAGTLQPALSSLEGEVVAGAWVVASRPLAASQSCRISSLTSLPKDLCKPSAVSDNLSSPCCA